MLGRSRHFTPEDITTGEDTTSSKNEITLCYRTQLRRDIPPFYASVGHFCHTLGHHLTREIITSRQETPHRAKGHHNRKGEKKKIYILLAPECHTPPEDLTTRCRIPPHIKGRHFTLKDVTLGQRAPLYAKGRHITPMGATSRQRAPLLPKGR